MHETVVDTNKYQAKKKGKRLYYSNTLVINTKSVECSSLKSSLSFDTI